MFCFIFSLSYNLQVLLLLLFLNWRLLQTEAEVDKIAQFMQIYRSREVGQSYFTSVWTTVIATLHALWLMIKIRPQVVFIFSINLQIIRPLLLLENLLWCVFSLTSFVLLQILCNGPGTCIPLCLIAFIFKVQYCIKMHFFCFFHFRDHMICRG